MNHTVEVLPGGRTLHVPDGTTLLTALQAAGLPVTAPCGGQGTCGKCRVQLREADGWREVLACRTAVDRDMVVNLPEEDTQVLEAGCGEAASADRYGADLLLAYDVGTTTVVCYLLDGCTGKELAAAGTRNPQAAYGADVVTRIRRAGEGDRPAMTAAIREAMAALANQVCRKSGAELERVGVVSVVGNPCMQQLLLGMDVRNLAGFPFAPALTHSEIRPVGDILPACRDAKLLVVPDLAGYVGADTLACVLATRLYEAERPVLLVDIGTNGEMVLGDRHRMVACATAAGPALEGANIRFGMTAAPGAIDRVWNDHGALRLTTIGRKHPVGLCGSGLIDAVAVLLRAGAVNGRGRIVPENLPLEMCAEADGQPAVRLAGDVLLTQRDLREVQLAKGAIAAGIRLMAEYLELSLADISQVLLAGAFGSYILPESACAIGLLPPELEGKIRVIGNAAGSGAKILALSPAALHRADRLLERIDCLELALLPGFQRAFADRMYFQEVRDVVRLAF